MDKIKDSFKRVKEDFLLMKEELFFLKNELKKNNELLIETGNALSRLNKAFLEFKESQTPKPFFKTGIEENKTKEDFFKAQKGQILGISTGNEGVQTDRQTDRQTDKQGVLEGNFPPKDKKNSFEEAIKALDSLDNLKKEIRLKFKRLTPQELLIFSALYQLEEEKGFSDYKSLSLKVNLTESSVRDYVRRLILKGIPVEKSKENNKEIRLYVSQNLKKVASLDTILKLVDL